MDGKAVASPSGTDAMWNLARRVMPIALRAAQRDRGPHTVCVMLYSLPTWSQPLLLSERMSRRRMGVEARSIKNGLLTRVWLRFPSIASERTTC